MRPAYQQHVRDGAFQAGHRSPSDQGPWTYHWADENGWEESRQYWMKDEPAPTGDIPRHPIAEYREARTRGRQSGHGTRGLREGYSMGILQGFQDGYDDVDSGGRAWQTGVGHGMFFGGMDGYNDGFEDYQYGACDAGFGGGPYDEYDGGFGGDFDEGYGGYGGGSYGGDYDGGLEGYDDEYYGEAYGGGYGGGYEYY